MVTYAGCDWLTITSTKEGVGEHWYRMYIKHRKEFLSDELRERNWNNGFYAGLQTGGLRWGYSDRFGYIIIASGALAEKYYQRFEPAKHKVTRLDLCYDFEMPSPTMLADRFYDYLCEHQATKYPKVNLYRSRLGGGTLYIGSRQSAQYGRLYDKGVEQGIAEPGKLWRAEIEYKKPLSGQIASQLAGYGSTSRAETIQVTVWHWFKDRLVTLPAKPESGQLMPVAYTQVITTKERKLAWLKSQVRPTVIDLCKAGVGPIVLANLGFTRQSLEQILREKLD